MLQRPSSIEPFCSRHTLAGATTALLIICGAILVISSAWLVTGCAQSNTNAGDPKQQTRQRRASDVPQTESNVPDGANVKEESGRKMPETNVERKSDAAPAPFYTALEKALEARKMKLENVCDRSHPVERRVLEDYGAMFLAHESVKPPPVCLFKSEAEATKFQNEAGFTAATIGGSRIELQPAAMAALLAAREEARKMGLQITPRGGAEAARRSYNDTLRLWNTRFLPALSYWNKRGRLSDKQVARLRQLPLHDQVREVLELEKSGIFFSKDFSKSILYSIAAPGTSQHIAMLALDVTQFADARVRSILARHGWFQTVKSDLPHFTFLGVEENALPALGLRPVKSGSQLFWVPAVGEEKQG